ncbi:hypothetical protein [Brunnivagina elsteri]|nr:hypothetical protein [Calothrix elsteri]
MIVFLRHLSDRNFLLLAAKRANRTNERSQMVDRIFTSRKT